MENFRDEIAIIGMTARYPGAKNIEEFWRNLQEGVESISFFSDEQLLSVGVDPVVLASADYVKAGGVIDGADLFDAPFFGFTAREAELMDPQQRIFLECAWEALESSGYEAEKYQGLIGMYAGVGANFYLINNIDKNPGCAVAYDPFEITILNDKDFLATRAAYKLNLKGPALSVQTACSTSLVAVHLACQSLLSFQCDMALAGGIRVRPQQQSGYLYREGMTVSPDGHCRAFDAKAQGTVRSSGAGIVVLKRLDEARKDRDHIYAVIKGSAVNNDGSLKVGYTAPSIDGQAEVIALAQAAAGIDAETIGYVEAHGTGTPLGDPIEIAGLTQAFRAQTTRKTFCAIGSIKTNIGHTEAAAGVAGLIKTALALQNKTIPPSLHYRSPNPRIDFAGSPFYVNTKLSEWQAGETPRRAGVSSFGVGGTNAHVVLEEAPAAEPVCSSRRHRLVVMSAQTSKGLEAAATNLAAHLKRHPEMDLGNVAYTLQVGRKRFRYRRFFVCQERDDAIKALETVDPRRVLSAVNDSTHPNVVFTFPGQGSQHVNMGLEVYRCERDFRDRVDFCCEFLKPLLGLDLREALYPNGADLDAAEQTLKQTIFTQPALFVTEYALASLLMDWGVKPRAMIGHSIGEYVAACLAGVFSLEDGLSLVAARGRLMNQMPPGGMMAVPLSPEDVEPLLGEELSLAAHNGPELCVLSGQTKCLEELEKRLREKAIESRYLETSHAFHSHLMEGALQPFAEHVREVRLHPPKIPYLSNVTGSWITDEQATDPNYWVRQMRQTVRFSESFTRLSEISEAILLELGPGRTLSAIATQHGQNDPRRTIVRTMRHPADGESDSAFLAGALGRLWLAGVELDWAAFNCQETLRRVPLPTYPFERRRYWIEPATFPASQSRSLTGEKQSDIAEWFYIPSWKRSVPPTTDAVTPMEENSCWLVFADSNGLGKELVTRLARTGQHVVTVVEGEKFRADNDHCFTINPRQPEHYKTLVHALAERGYTRTRIVHLWGVGPNAEVETALLDRNQDLLFFSLLYLAQALSDRRVGASAQISVVTSNLQNITGEEGRLFPEKATVLGPCKVIPWEYPGISCRAIDISVPAGATQVAKLLEWLIAELTGASSDSIVAYRGGHRWVQIFEPVRLPRQEFPARLRRGGVYLITGGLGGLGVEFADYLARTAQAKLVLTARTALPPRDEWERQLASHDLKGKERCTVERLLKLEKLGAEVLVIPADVADAAQMENVVKKTRERFGEIRGVIHSAGVPGGGIVQLKTREAAESVLAPKIKGTRTIEALFRNVKLDFLVLCSSLTAILGGPGRVDYCAANAFLDAFANCRHGEADGRLTVSINWDTWQSVGMAANATLHAAIRAEREGRIEKGIAPAEGIDVLSRILGSSLPQILVSPRELGPRLNEQIRTLHRVNDTKNSEAAGLGIAHPRPDLLNLYLGPQNEVEKELAHIWQAVLGIEKVGIHDDFFELGGHSLLATQVVSRVRHVFKMELPLRSLLDNKTIYELAKVIGDLWGDNEVSEQIT